MGKVVKLDRVAGDGSTRAARGAHAARDGAKRRPARRSKTALVLGGGGFTGGVYEIGALRAIDLLSVNRTVNEFDVYVGTSTGAFVAAALANGVTPEEMMRVIVQRGADAVPGRPDRLAAEAQLRRVPHQGADAAAAAGPRWSGTLARDLGQLSAVDVAVGARRGAAVGAVLRARASSATCARSSPTPSRTDDFRLLGPRALPRGHRSRHLRADRARRARAGTTSRSPGRSAPPARCRCSTSRSRSRATS